MCSANNAFYTCASKNSKQVVVFLITRRCGAKFTPQQSGGPKLKIWASIKSLGLTHSKWGLTFKVGTNI